MQKEKKVISIQFKVPIELENLIKKEIRKLIADIKWKHKNKML